MHSKTLKDLIIKKLEDNGKSLSDIIWVGNEFFKIELNEFFDKIQVKPIWTLIEFPRDFKLFGDSFTIEIGQKNIDDDFSYENIYRNENPNFDIPEKTINPCIYYLQQYQGYIDEEGKTVDDFGDVKSILIDRDAYNVV